MSNPFAEENPNPFAEPSTQPSQADFNPFGAEQQVQEPVQEVVQEPEPDLSSFSYIEMMCAAPRHDNAAARKILSPQTSSVDLTTPVPMSRTPSMPADPRKAKPAKRKNSAPIEKKGKAATLAKMKENIKRMGALGGDKSTEGVDMRQYVIHKLTKANEMPSSGPAGNAAVIPQHINLSALTCKGYLTKQGSKRKNWLERWFVMDLKKGNLCYYASMEETAASLKGEILLSDITQAIRLVTDADKGSNKFSIVTRGRTYNVQADTHNTMMVWMEIINAVGHEQ
eukprot:m.332609 g.332609  ORF g.332609 m.332609 type:complete len:283 (-) comp16968_c0_seq1:77-925(-)